MPIETRSLPIIEKKLELYDDIIRSLETTCSRCTTVAAQHCHTCDNYAFVERARDIAKMTDY